MSFRADCAMPKVKHLLNAMMCVHDLWQRHWDYTFSMFEEYTDVIESKALSRMREWVADVYCVSTNRGASC